VNLNVYTVINRYQQFLHRWIGINDYMILFLWTKRGNSFLLSGQRSSYVVHCCVTPVRTVQPGRHLYFFSFVGLFYAIAWPY